MFFLTKSGLFSCFFIAKTHFIAVLPSKEKTMSGNGKTMSGDKWIMSGERKITSGDMCKFSRKIWCIVGSYFSIVVVYKIIAAVYKNNVESKIDILLPGLFISSLFIRYAPFKNKEKPRKTNKNQVGTNKNLFFLVSFCFSLFLKGA